MKTYKDLLDKLNKLNESQLLTDIVILSDGDIVIKEIQIHVDENPLYEFKDTDNNSYCEFEDSAVASEYISFKIIDANLPILIIK